MELPFTISTSVIDIQFTAQHRSRTARCSGEGLGTDGHANPGAASGYWVGWRAAWGWAGGTSAGGHEGGGQGLAAARCCGGEPVVFPAWQNSPSSAEEPLGAVVTFLLEADRSQFQKGVN